MEPCAHKMSNRKKVTHTHTHTHTHTKINKVTSAYWKLRLIRKRRLKITMYVF